MVCANVAQLFRALPCQGRGRELESLHSHHFFVIKITYLGVFRRSFDHKSRASLRENTDLGDFY